MQLLTKTYLFIALVAGMFLFGGVQLVQTAVCCMYYSDIQPDLINCVAEYKDSKDVYKKVDFPCSWVEKQKDNTYKINIKVGDSVSSDQSYLESKVVNKGNGTTKKEFDYTNSILVYQKNLFAAYPMVENKNCINSKSILEKESRMYPIPDPGEFGVCAGESAPAKEINKLHNVVKKIVGNYEKSNKTSCCLPKPAIQSNLLESAKCILPGSSHLVILPEIPVKKEDGKLSKLFDSLINEFFMDSDNNIKISEVFRCGTNPLQTDYIIIGSPCGSTKSLKNSEACTVAGKEFDAGLCNSDEFTPAVYCAIKEQVKAYCICLAEDKCLETKYSDKPTCLLAAKGINGAKGCEPLDGEKKDCSELETKNKTPYEPITEDFNIPDISELNQLAPGTTVQKLIGRLLKIGVGFLGTLVFALFIFGGVMFMTSSASGNSEGVGKAKEIILWTTAGLFIILASYSITNILFSVVEPSGVTGSTDAISASACYCDSAIVGEATKQDDCNIKDLIKLDGKNQEAKYSSCEWKEQKK